MDLFMRIYFFLFVSLVWLVACDVLTVPQLQTDQELPDLATLDAQSSPELDLMVLPDATQIIDQEMVDQMSSTLDAAVDQEAPTDLDVLDFMLPEDMEQFDMELPDMELPDEGDFIRAPCFLGAPIVTGLSSPPQSCSELFQLAPQLESGCYEFTEPSGQISQGYCWRHRGLLFLLNNELDTEPNPNDLDEDGVIDQGERSGLNFPADPFTLNPLEVAQRLQREVRSFFREISFGALIIDLEVYWAGEGTTERSQVPTQEILDLEQWYRLRVLRPSFANENLMLDLCRRRGGMRAVDWRAYDFIATVISHGTSTSGSQFRREDLPTGENCDQTAVVATDYIVAKNFRSWNRLGTLFHEITHALSRDPLQEPSIGHSEATHARTGNNSEYGDMTDLMGRSGTRGHLSGPQKAFLRYLPQELIHRVSLIDERAQVRLSPLEPNVMQPDEKRLIQIEVNEGMYYYVEVRREIGEDARLDPIFFTGALVKRARSLDQANKSFIIDPTPETPTTASDDSVLFPHRVFSDVDNRIHISVIESDESGVNVIVRRGTPSRSAPLIDDVDIVIERGDDDEVLSRTLTATASTAEADVSDEDLLYFWKLGAREELYEPSSFRTGRVLRLSGRQRPTQIWLLVSDQKGGQTWHLVPTMEEEAPVCGDGMMSGDEECDDGNQVTETCSVGDEACEVCAEDCTLVAGQLCPTAPAPPSPIGPNCTDTCDCMEQYNFTQNQANNGICEVYSFPVFEEYCCAYGTDCTDCQGPGQPPVSPPCQAGSSGTGGLGLADASACSDACCPGVRWQYPLDPSSLRPDQRPEICDDCSWSVEEDQCGRITHYWIYGSFNSFQGFSDCALREIDADNRRCQYDFEYDAAGNLTHDDKTCYFRIEANLIERWRHSYDAQGRRVQSEHWLETTDTITRTVTHFDYDEFNRVALETVQGIPLSQTGFDQLGDIPEDLTPIRSRAFAYGACEITISTDEEIDGSIDEVETIAYPEWW